MRCMDFHGIETGLSGPQGGCDKTVLALADTLLGHCLRDNLFGVPFMHTMHNGRGSNRLFAANITPCMPPAMSQLDRGFRTLVMDDRNKLAQSFQKAVII